MRILVTGVAGFIGSHIAESFTDTEHDVYVIDKLASHYSLKLKRENLTQLADSGVSFFELDLAKDDLKQTNLDSLDIVIHCAAQPGISETVSFDQYLQNNKVATHRLLQWLYDHDEQPFIINISSSSVYGLKATGDETAELKPASDYGVTKLAAEQLALSRCRQNKLPATSLRLFSVFGPRERPEKLFPKLIHAAETDEPL
jgi:nucleoside-diphosphate-sugar epimerase